MTVKLFRGWILSIQMMLVDDADNEKLNIPITVRITDGDVKFIDEFNRFHKIHKNKIIHYAINSYRKIVSEEMGEEQAKVDVERIPKFIFNGSATNEELYNYLQNNPKASLFIFNKYKNNRDFLKEICDPLNPIYLEMVAESLRETFDISSLKEDIDKLKRERSNILGQIDEAKKELTSTVNELDSAEARLPELTKQLDNMQKLLGNLSQEETIKRIKSFYESVDKFIQAAFEAQKKQPITESFNSIRLDMNQINLLRVLQKSIKDDLDYIENRDLLSEEGLDAKRKEIKERMEKEMQEGETAMQAFQLHNPIKTLNKSLNSIEEAQEQLANAGEFSRESGWFYNIHTIPNIQAILDVPKELLTNLITQVNNVNVRKK
jgi:hypothetical protein